jgi:chromosome segregation ATPase
VQQELQTLRSDIGTLRADLRAAEGSAVAAQTGRDSALARCSELGKQVVAERARGEQTARELSAVQQQLGEATTRGAEREQAMEKVLAEREKSIAELKAAIEQSKAALTETLQGDRARDRAQAERAEQLLQPGEGAVREPA